MHNPVKGFWQRLDRRLISLICIAVLPINFLAIWFSSLVVRESQDKLYLSQSREFQILVSQESVRIQSLEQWCADYIQANLNRMLQPKRFSAVFSIYATNQMAVSMEETKIPGFVFVQEHMEEEKLYLRSSKDLLTMPQVTEIKAEMQPFLRMQHNMVYTNSMQMFLGRLYYVGCYSMNNCTIGFAVDLNQMLERWNSSLLEECRIGFAEQNGVWIMNDNTFIHRSEESVVNPISRASWGDVSIILISDDSKPNVPSSYVILQVFAWGSLALLVLLWFMIRRQVIEPLQVLRDGMVHLEQSVDYRIEHSADTVDFTYLYNAFNRMAEDIQQSHEKDILIYQTQLNNLKLQVNPHMLLNSLSMIHSMAHTRQNELIQKFTLQLVEYFRYCLRENNDLVQLQSELRFVSNYIELQKTRFPGEISYAYYVDEELESALIPPLLIQNFVENATKYARTSGQLTEILLWIRSDADRLCITIEDTGKGISPEVLSVLNNNEMYVDSTGMQHIGVWNCRRRLDIFYKGNAKMMLESSVGKGTKVYIEIPLLFHEGDIADDFFNRG